MIKPSAISFLPVVRKEFGGLPVKERSGCIKYLQSVIEKKTDPRRLARVCRTSHPAAYELPLGAGCVVFTIERFAGSDEIAAVIVFAGQRIRPGSAFETRAIAPRLAELDEELQR